MGSAVGGIVGGTLGLMGANKQADAMEDATKRSIGLQREQFDYAKSLQEALLQQQEPRRQSSQRAMRSLSMMLGLGDPGPSASIPQQQELQSLKDQLGGMDQYTTETGPTPQSVQNIANARGGAAADRFSQMTGAGATSEQVLNPEYESLQQEIAALEAELPGGEGFEDDFDGPKDVTELPGYQFTMNQGLDALSSSGAARGMQLSGSQMEDITKFGQGVASGYRTQLIGELQKMAGMRPSTAPVTNMSNLATGQADALGPLMQQQGAIGAAEAAGTYGNLAGIVGSMPWGQMGGATHAGGNVQYPGFSGSGSGPGGINPLTAGGNF